MKAIFPTPEMTKRLRRSIRTLSHIAAAFIISLLTACRPPEAPRAVDVQANQGNHFRGPAAISDVYKADERWKWVDVTDEANIDFTYRNGREAEVFSIVESLGGGVGVLDYDHDGRWEILFPGGGTFGPGETLSGFAAALFRPSTAWQYTNISRLAHVDTIRHYTHGCAIADYDNDGFSDVLVTGYGGLQLFHNLGDGTFVESQELAGLHDQQWSSSAAWGDFNGDGALDLYIAHYVNWSWENNPKCILPRTGKPDVCPPRDFEGLDDVIYFSNGDGTFMDRSPDVKLSGNGKGLGVLAADFDLDRDLDIYVANDTTENFLYLNRGDGKFDEEGTVRGAALDDRGAPNGSMGLALLDYNQDASPDIWVANFENESFALYRNEGGAVFTHASQSAGIHTLGPIYVAFGTAAADFDRDGDEDLVVSNGHVVYFPHSGHVNQVPLLLDNDNGRFRRIEFDENNYFGQRHYGRGLAVGDLDNDGDLDAVFSHNNDRSAVLRNDTVPEGNWLGLRCIGTRGNRSAIGVRATLKTSRGEQVRQVYGGGSYLSQSDPRLFWGIPADARAESIHILWPSGAEQTIAVDSAGRYLTVVEP